MHYFSGFSTQMKKPFLSWLVGFLWGASLLPAAGAPTDFWVVRDHQPEAVIYLPPESDPAIQMAAAELQTYFKKMSQAELPIVAKPSKKKPFITFRVLPDDVRDLFVHDTFTIETTDGSTVISGHSGIAVLYGAYQLLNDLGVRWFSPGEIGEQVPSRADVVLPIGRKTSRPSFRTRVIDYNGTDDWHFSKTEGEKQHQDYDLWLLRNKLKFSRLIHNKSKAHGEDFGWTREHSYHNIRNAALGRNWKTNDKLEAERLALTTEDKSTERRKEKAQVCLTHEKNIETAVQSAVDYFQEFPDRVTYPLSLDDHDGFCECARCTEANGGISPAIDPNRVVWKFMNTVAKKLNQKLPGKRIAFYATYQKMTHPPYDIQAEHNLVAVTCHVSSQARPIADPEEPRNVEYLDNIRLVKDSGAEMGSYDYFMFPGNPQPLSLLEDFPLYQKLGYRWYAAEWMGRDEQRNIVAWVLAQLAWDANQDPRALLEAFCQGYYGAAGPVVLRWLDLIDSRVRELKRLTFGHLSLTALMLTPPVVEKSRALLAEAKSLVSGREAERVRRLALTFESWQQAAEVERCYKKALQLRTKESKEAALGAVTSFEKLWQENNLQETCSPRLLDHYIKAYTEKIEKITPTVTTAAKEDPMETDRPTTVAALFSHAAADRSTILRESATNGAPQVDENIFLLPEVWKFQIAPEDANLAGEPNDKKNTRPPPWSASDFDDSSWFELSSYNSFDAQGFAGYMGVFWYRLKFRAPEFPKGAPVWLRIGGLDDGGVVYLNGRRAGVRENVRDDDWKTSFAFEVTDLIKPGRENVLAIRGYNIYGAGGLWRPTGLYTRALRPF